MTDADRYRGPNGMIIPPFVYLPVESGDTSFGAAVTLWYLQDGRKALLAYTALDRLYNCLGENQAWAVYPTDRLSDLDSSTKFDVIYFDVSVD